MLVREIIRWAEYEPPPGEAVSGNVTITVSQPKDTDDG